MPSYSALEPSSFSALGINTPSLSSSLSFYDVSVFIYTLFFVAIVAAAFYQYVLVGVYRMEASESGIRKSNETFKRVTLGLFGVFGLFLLLGTLNSGLLTGDISLSSVRADPVPAGQTSTTQNPQTQSNTPPIPRTNDDPVGWDAIKNDATVRSELASLPNGGISVNKKVCIVPTQTSCTTVGGLPAETISMLKNLRSACSGTIMVTGGTEAGHKSHGPGKTPVDLSLHVPGGLESCIRSFPTGPQVSFCKRTYVNFGYIFCDENLGIAHWHIYKQ